MRDYNSWFRDYKNLFLVVLILNTLIVFFTTYKQPVPAGFDTPYYLYRTDILFDEGIISYHPPWNITARNGEVVDAFIDYPSVYLILNLISQFFNDMVLPVLYAILISNLLMLAVFSILRRKTSDKTAFLTCLFMLSSYAYLFLVHALLKNLLAYLLLILLIHFLSEKRGKSHFLLLSLCVFFLAVTHTLIFVYLCIMFLVILKFLYEKRYSDTKYYLSAILLGLLLSMPVADFLFFNYESNIIIRSVALWNAKRILMPILKVLGTLLNITSESLLGGVNLFEAIIFSEIFSFSKLTIVFYFNLFLFPFFIIGFFNHLKKIKSLDDKDFFILIFGLGSLISFILEFIYPSRALLLMIFPFCYYAALGFKELSRVERDKLFLSIIISILFLGILEINKFFSVTQAHNFYSISSLIDELGLIYLFFLGSIMIMMSKIDFKLNRKISSFLIVLFVIFMISPQAYYTTRVQPYANEKELEVTDYVNTYLDNASFVVVPRFHNWFFYFTRAQAERPNQHNFYLAFYNKSIDYLVWAEPHFEWVPILLDMVNVSDYPIVFNNSEAVIYKIR